MTVTGLLSSYGLTGGVPVTIDEVIDLLDPTDLPFQNGYTLLGNVIVPALGSLDITNKKYEWQDDTLLDTESTINEGGNFLVGDTTLTVTDGDRFRPGDVIRIEDEHLYVSAVSSDDLTVIRGFAGTTAAQHADGLAIKGVGQALAEGSDAVSATHKDRDRRYNYTGIAGPRSIKASGTEQVMPKYGLVRGGEMMYQLMKETIKLAKDVERAILYSVRYDDGADQRTTGGLMASYTTNVNSTSGDLTMDTISAMVEDIWDVGGGTKGLTLAFNLRNKRVVSKFDATKIEIVREDAGRGQVVEYIDTDAGRVALGVSRFFDDSDALMYDRDQCSFGWLRPWQIDPLAKTGDADTVQTVGEYGVRVKRQRHGGKFTALTQSVL